MVARLLVSVALLFAEFFIGAAAAQSRQGPPPEVSQIVTKDGVQLTLTYFPSAARKGSAEAKQAPPVVLLHDHKETRAVFNSLAQRLQSPGEDENNRPSFAAVTVDLRGHGDSTTRILQDSSHIDLDAARLAKQDFLAMAAYDMEAVRSFLVAKNDAGELNLNKLCLLGAGLGASVASNWAVQDWSAPPLAIGKQGQDVKALVLISPRWSYTGLTFQAPMRFRALKEQAAWMLVYGSQDAKVRADAVRINKQLERFHTDAKKAAAGRASSLLVLPWPSKLEGSTLLKQVGEPLETKIVDFLVQQVAQRQHPWSSRLERIPLSQ